MKKLFFAVRLIALTAAAIIIAADVIGGKKEEF